MRRSRHSRAKSRGDPDLDAALAAIPADELRTFVRDALDQLDDETRGPLVDALISRTAQGNSGWRPTGPCQTVIEEVQSFAQAARRVGYCDPLEIDDYLRQGTKAFLAGDHATARAVFEALLLPIAEFAIDLGQHETVDEVLTASFHDCSAQYLVAVYETTPLEHRANVLREAIDAVLGGTIFIEPLKEMERVATGPLSDLEVFLPNWLARLEREPAPDNDWDDERDRWLREAVLRIEGIAGLERVARASKKPAALGSWCSALVDRGDWLAALRAYDEAAELVRKPHSRGRFLDGAALAAQQLERRDVGIRLKSAWLAAPSLVRLLRCLGSGSPTERTLRKRAVAVLDGCPLKAGRQLGLLYVLIGDADRAAKLLAKVPGIGWSDENHPAHVLFPAFAGILAGGSETTLSKTLAGGLESSPSDSFEIDWEGHGEFTTDQILATPTVAKLIELARPSARIDAETRAVMFNALRTAATKRVRALLRKKLRRHYGHAAMLVACCLELSGTVGQKQAVSQWIAGLRRTYSRFSAFQRELDDALALVAT